MAKAVILKTNTGIYLFGSMQCCNDSWFDAEGCYKYCQEKTEFYSFHHSQNLKFNATKIGHERTKTDWYKHRKNFIDIEVPFECTQDYQNSN